MDVTQPIASLKRAYIKATHAESDYFAFVKGCLQLRQQLQKNCPDYNEVNRQIAVCYSLLHDEIKSNDSRPKHPVSFGTSGWRGILGKDLFVKSVKQVALGIVELYKNIDKAERSLKEALGVSSLAETRKRGCVVGHDNRFGGETLAQGVNDVLSSYGFTVHYAGEATTGTLSAAVLELHAAFSINLTPSHNPLEYGGFKYNAADAGPAASLITRLIAANARKNIEQDLLPALPGDPSRVHPIDALALWKNLVRKNQERHGLNYDGIMKTFRHRKDVAVAVDCVHGASRVHMHDLFNLPASGRFMILRGEADPTFGGIAPEPSSSNLKMVKETLAERQEPLKVGMIIDPDADRIRFVDPSMEIGMNQFGAMAYHYLHEIKDKKGILAKTVATSNFGNAIAKALHEEIFEPPVGFKEFKPVIGKALVCFEESDGISVIGHTPEKDAYIGLLLALDMIMTLNKNLSLYLEELEEKYGAFFPDRDGVKVSIHGQELTARLGSLKRFSAGKSIEIDGRPKTVKELITIDGYKIIFEDNSWLMIRPSGTEPKVRFYVEARTEKDKKGLFKAAAQLLKDMELLS
jgi:phosphomannomutase